MTLSDHIKLSVSLELARLSLTSGLCKVLQYHVRKDSREYREINKAIECINHLKNWMDGIVCHEKPDGIGSACVKVYYHVSDSIGVDECDNVLGNYAVRHAMHLLHGEGRQMDADEIVLTKFDSSNARFFDETRHEDAYMHIKAGTCYTILGYDGVVSRRPPEDEHNPSQVAYALAPCQIRDFCEDAMKSGRYPSDDDIERAVGGYRIYSDDE